MKKACSACGAVWLVLGMLLVSCLGDNICGKEMVEKDGKCVKLKETDPSDNSSTETESTGDSPGDGGDDSEAEVLTLPVGMGDPCTESADCKGATDYCIQENAPADPNGYCTISGCTDDPDNCPETYICIDLSQYFAPLPWACAKRQD